MTRPTDAVRPGRPPAGTGRAAGRRAAFSPRAHGVAEAAARLWRGASIVALERLGRSRVYAVPFGRSRFRFRFLPLGRGHGSRGLYLKRAAYEPLLAHGAELLGPGAVAIDCGANQGIYTCAFGAAVGPSGRVVAVEPLPWQVERIEANVGLNGYGQCRVVEAAIADSEGTATLRLGGADVEASIVTDWPTGDRIEVPAVTLDALVEREGLERLDLVKLDVEGAEEMAVRGGTAALARFRPVVVCEALGPEGRRTADALGALGYAPFLREPDGYRAAREGEGGACVFYFPPGREVPRAA